MPMRVKKNPDDLRKFFQNSICAITHEIALPPA